jgi:hypothetical protein
LVICTVQACEYVTMHAIVLFTIHWTSCTYMRRRQTCMH